MSSSVPIVTVIIPNYNHARYLPQRLESVLGQTYQDFEVLLLDDCSPDNSREVIAAYAAADPRIRVVLNEQNSGSTFKQWNKGIALARGQYIWLAESDDYAHPELLATLVARLDADPAVQLAYAQSQAVDEEGKPLAFLDDFYDGLGTDMWQRDFVTDGRKLVTDFMSYRNLVPNASAVLTRREALLRIGKADETFRLNGDWIFWASIMVQGKVAFVAEKLNFFRFHTNNVRSKTHRNGLAIQEMARVVRTMEQYGAANPVYLAKSHSVLTHMWLHGIVGTSIPLRTYGGIYRSLKAIIPGFHGYFIKTFFNFMIGNKFSGTRRLIGDGILYKLLPKR